MVRRRGGDEGDVATATVWSNDGVVIGAEGRRSAGEAMVAVAAGVAIVFL